MIPKGEVIIEFTGPEHTKTEYIELLNPKNCHFLQINQACFMGPSGKADDLINHSCNPNGDVVYEDAKVFLIAIRDIQENKEVTFDYSTTMYESHWETNCICGEKTCRKKIRDFKHLPSDLKQKYLDLGLIAPFIL
ncbi:MAG: SET domain-containing protein [SAR324 cluster bacterium]|uniref:SET domain-containing protein n=1 Tax=SAR324 cluster bacterium TaxID=2024889 RepID=A0A7X9IJ18_9DELT|nr:SET domain-containing protein [SAR324 cluster bacterium]